MKKVRHSETEMVKAVQALKNGTSAEEVRYIQRNVIQLEKQVQRNGCESGEKAERVEG